MKGPNARLIVVSVVCLVIGYIAAWAIMAFILKTELRLFGFGYLSMVAFLVALVLIVLLDTPLKLGAFNWAWPKGDFVWPEADKQKRGPSLISRIANSLKVAAFVVGVVVLIAGFASLIPQVESPAPEVIEISGALSGPELANLGEEIVRSPEAGCLACHGLGQEGLRAPDLAGIGARAAEREPGKSAEEYLREAFEAPCAYVVEGYDCIMPPTLSQALGPTKITAVIAFLQSQGGEITVSLSGDEAAADSAAETDTAGTGTGVEGTTAEEILANVAPACGTCHQIDAVGATGALGPNLSEVGGRLTPDEMRESILAPDAVIAADCPGAPCTAGIMPKTFGEQLSAAQLETLVEFLSSLGGPGGEAGSTSE
jgi:cytochrome c2